MKLFSSLHLKTKLIASILVTSLIAVLLTSFALVRYDRYHWQKNSAEDIRILAAILANRSTAALIFGDPRQAEANLKALGENPNVLMACIYDSGGDVFTLHHFRHLNRRDCPPVKEDAFFSIQENMEIFEPIELDGLKVGTLYMELSLEWLAQRWREQLVFIMIVVVCTLFIAFGIARYLQKLLVRPIKQIADTADNISRKGDYSLRANKTVDDELGDLVSVFNNMLEEIEGERLSLHSSEEKFRQLASLSPVGIFQIDLQHKITYVNQRWCEITDIHEPSATLDQWLTRIRSEDRRATLKAWTDLISNNQSFVIEVGFERDGKTTWTIVEASVLRDAQSDITGYMGAISDITDLKNAQLQMETLAFYDPLTGLSNRRLFKERLKKAVSEAQRRHTYVGLLFLDLDQFKRINDSMGHDAGDQLLISVAERLINSVRESDTVSRIGGDEFTVLLTDMESSHDVRHIADKILVRLGGPVNIKNQDVTNTVSIGITMAPTDSTDANILMRNADLAMYRAKELGRNNFQFFSEEMNAEIMTYLEIEKDLRKAVEKDDELVVYYQPKIDLTSYDFMGVEALIRWHRPSGDIVSPAQFIPIAEESGLIVPIGKLVLRHACIQIKQFMDFGLWPVNAKVAVNLSAKQFSDPGLIQSLQDILDSTGCPVTSLELEITESTLMDNVEDAIMIMRQIKKMGIAIAIDDFGTGYSSLSYLKRFPIDVLKVDRSFVMDIPSDLNDMEITAAVIAMAHKLNLRVVAEGVETPEQLEFLKANRCEYAQGFYIARPMPAAELESYIKQPQPFGLMP